MIIKCKMCGGDLEFTPGATYGTCEYCGSTSTIPQADDESKLNRYNRANHFRRQCEFDKAVAAYEKLLEQDDTDAEAHWGAVISRFGIEYVEDPATKKRIPTCHRVQVASILADADYLAAVENAPDEASRELYKQQAAEIAEIQKGILAISSNEKPYDVFICYKETDENGQRTRDSQWAQEVYYGLTEQGYKVFFSRITLEDKLGQQYEPYIFAALNSAKVMVVIGSKPEYFNAVWVKNEWSRYLALMAKDRKRLLIPCYRGMDPYDLPEELSSLQSQDMSKIGFMQDLLRGVKKVLDADKKAEQPKVVERVVQSGSDAGSPGVASLMKRVKLFMEDGDFKQAAEYLDRVLDIDPECAPAYAAKVCVTFGIRKESGLAETTFQYEDNADWQKAMRFANAQQKATYEGYTAKVKERVEAQIFGYAYDCAVEMAVNPKANRASLDSELLAYKNSCTRSSGNRANGNRRQSSQLNEDIFKRAVRTNEPGDVSEQGLKSAASMFDAIKDRESAEKCRTLAEQARQKLIYTNAVMAHDNQKNSPSGLEEVARTFMTVPDYKDAVAQARKCNDEAEAIRDSLYNSATYAMQSAGSESSKWEAAKQKLAERELNDYRDVAQLRVQAAKRYDECLAAEKEAQRQKEEKAAREAAAAKAKKTRMTIIGVIAAVLVIAVVLVVTQVIIPNNNYNNAAQLMANGQYEEAITAFEALNGYSDSATQIQEAKYQQAGSLTAEGKYTEAYAVYATISGYKDVDNLVKQDENLSAEAAAATREPFTKVGNIVTYGHYEQDNNTGNGKEAIEWIVLEYDSATGQALLLSRYGLDAHRFDASAYQGWDKSEIREWLNSTFLNTAFTEKEQEGIVTTTVKTGNNADWVTFAKKKNSFYDSVDGGSDTQDKIFLLYDSVDGGSDTQDKIFLLSLEDAMEYGGYSTLEDFYNKGTEKLQAVPTAYAVAQGAWQYSGSDSSCMLGGTGCCWWWLRSPGSYSLGASLVRGDGGLGYGYVLSVDGSVRPAFWLNLEALHTEE